MMLSQMDVPARQAYVMAMVPPEERVAAASVTNLPRSLVWGSVAVEAYYSPVRTVGGDFGSTP